MAIRKEFRANGPTTASARKTIEPRWPSNRSKERSPSQHLLRMTAKPTLTGSYREKSATLEGSKAGGRGLGEDLGLLEDHSWDNRRTLSVTQVLIGSPQLKLQPRARPASGRVESLSARVGITGPTQGFWPSVLISTPGFWHTPIPYPKTARHMASRPNSIARRTMSPAPRGARRPGFMDRSAWIAPLEQASAPIWVRIAQWVPVSTSVQSGGRC
jgi:hypothetical protein